MLKGSNKRVVEVQDLENAYFERAILFLKPDCEIKDAGSLRSQAGSCLHQLQYRPHRMCRWRSFLLGTLKILLGTVSGLLLYGIFF